jgi:hypothetical protein
LAVDVQVCYCCCHICYLRQPSLRSATVLCLSREQYSLAADAAQALFRFLVRFIWSTKNLSYVPRGAIGGPPWSVIALHQRRFTPPQ